MECRRPGFDPWVEKSPRRREWIPPPVFFFFLINLIFSCFTELCWFMPTPSSIVAWKIPWTRSLAGYSLTVKTVGHN